MEVYDEDGNKHTQVSTLDAFEHFCKIYVDFGLGLFAFVNAGIVIKVSLALPPLARRVPSPSMLGHRRWAR